MEILFKKFPKNENLTNKILFASHMPPAQAYNMKFIEFKPFTDKILMVLRVFGPFLFSLLLFFSSNFKCYVEHVKIFIKKKTKQSTGFVMKWITGFFQFIIQAHLSYTFRLFVC